MGSDGFVAIVNTIESTTSNVAAEGSPIFQLHQEFEADGGGVPSVNIRIAQYFSEPHQNRVYLRYE